MATSVVRVFEYVDVLASGLTDTAGGYLLDTEGAYLLDTNPTLVVGGAVAGVVPSVLSQGSRAVLVDPNVAGATVRLSDLTPDVVYPELELDNAILGVLGQNALGA